MKIVLIIIFIANFLMDLFAMSYYSYEINLINFNKLSKEEIESSCSITKNIVSVILNLILFKLLMMTFKIPYINITASIYILINASLLYFNNRLKQEGYTKDLWRIYTLYKIFKFIFDSYILFFILF